MCGLERLRLQEELKRNATRNPDDTDRSVRQSGTHLHFLFCDENLYTLRSHTDCGRNCARSMASATMVTCSRATYTLTTEKRYSSMRRMMDTTCRAQFCSISSRASCRKFSQCVCEVHNANIRVQIRLLVNAWRFIQHGERLQSVRWQRRG